MTEEKLINDNIPYAKIAQPHFEVTDARGNYIYTLERKHWEKVAILQDAGNGEDTIKYISDNCISKRRTDKYYQILAERLEQDVKVLAKAALHNNESIIRLNRMNFINFILIGAGLGFKLIDIFFK